HEISPSALSAKGLFRQTDSSLTGAGFFSYRYTAFQSCEFRVNSCEKRLFFSHTQLQKCS
ncbi:MAG TPA: hypothetical protein P5092_15200, partial [Ruminococcus sp.]|nr:hypothetical protein [Ruminococcus sp.]